MSAQINLIGPLSIQHDIIDTHLFSILIDGGVKHNLILENSVSIGDSDSSEGISHTFQLNPEKNRSDLAHALDLIPKQTKHVNCHGLFGGRLDHQLFILGDIHHFQMDFPASFHIFSSEKIKMYLLPAGDWSLEINSEFSILNLFEQEISLHGAVKYPIQAKNNILPMTSQLLSNVGTGFIEIKNEKPLTIYINE
jgi:thiamine pyrophosphokinase